MTRTLMLAVVVAMLAPLSAQSLMERYHDGQKPSKVAKAWFKQLDDWVNKLHEQARDPITWFPDASGKLRRYRLEAATPSALTARELLDTGNNNANGEPERIPAKETVTFTWKQWPRSVMASTYPTTTNENAADVVAFAAWLYDEDAAMEANRVLTVLHQRATDDELQEAICEFIRDQEEIKGSPALKTFQVWDDLFKVFRTILITGDKADKFKADRETAAENRLTELTREYGDPAKDKLDKRTLTLEQLKFDLERWSKDFEDTSAATKLAPVQKKLLADVNADLAKVKVFHDLADGVEKAGPVKPADWGPVADDWEKALKLDPCSIHLLSKAANARYQQTAPEIHKKTFTGNYHVAKQAIDLYSRWLERAPGNISVIFNLGVLHHVRAERNDAIKRYNEVIALDRDATLTRKAHEYKDLE